jgi:hypothetical protein
MQINFDTSSLQPQEALGLIALLNNLIPHPVSTSFTPQAPQAPQAQAQTPAPSPKNEEQAIFGVPIQPADAPAAEPALAAEPPAEPSAEPVPVAKRHRRTKAEIAADEAAAKQAALAPAAGEPTATSAQVMTEPTTASATTKPLTAEELRALLNGYIARHSMEDAIGKLREFGCNRVTEALALEPVKLNALAVALNG